MKVNVKVSVSDSERDTLANYLDGKESARLATRKDVNNFLYGCLDAALLGQSSVDTYDCQLDYDAEIERLHKEGFNESYIRGWMKIGQSMGLYD